MNNIDWIQQTLGITVKPRDKKSRIYPNFILSRYMIEAIYLDNLEAVFVYPLETEIDLSTLKKHIRLISNEEKVPCVLIFKTLTTYRRNTLLKENIPFIVEKNQIYLPFLATYIQKKCSAESSRSEKLLPSAQLLLLYFIYNRNKKISLSEAVEPLKLTPMSVSRAAMQLETLSLINSCQIGRYKILSSDYSPIVLFEKALPYLQSPVKRTVFIPKEEITEPLVKSGLSALAEYSMLSKPKVQCFATKSISKWTGLGTQELVDSDNQVQVELWKYDPGILAFNQVADRLSLYLSLKDNEDERIEQSLSEILDDIREEIKGKRN